MIGNEIRELIPKFVQWIEIDRVTSFYPKDVAAKFGINEDSAKRLIKMVEKEVTEFELMKPRLDGKRVVRN